MKKLLWLVLLVALVATAQADTYYAKSTEWVTIPIKPCLDSAGAFYRTPDSGHVVTWASPDSVGQAIFSANTTTLANFQSSLHITRDTLFGMIYWNLKDSVGRLNAGATSRQIDGQVTMWWKSMPMTTTFTIYVLSAQTFVSAVDSIGLAAKNLLSTGVNVTSWKGGAVDTLGATGRPKVDVESWLGKAVAKTDTTGFSFPRVDVAYYKSGAVDTTGGTGKPAVTANVTKLLGTAVSTPATAGVLDVNVKNWSNVVVHNSQGNSANDTLPHVSLNQVEGVALGTHASGMVTSDMRDILGTAVSTPATAGILDVNIKNIGNSTLSTTTAQLGVNVVNWKGGAVDTLGATGRPKVDVESWLGKTVAKTDTTGFSFPRVDVAYYKSGAVDTTGGTGLPAVTANTTKWGGTAVASANVRSNLVQILSNTPDTTGATARLHVQTDYLKPGVYVKGDSLDNDTTLLNFLRAGIGGASSGMTATQNARLAALYYKLVDGDTLVKVRYISPYGDNSDGTTPTKAYTSPNSIGSDSNTIYIVGDGVYTSVNISILARNVSIYGNGRGRTIFINDSIARGTAQKDIITVYKPNCTISGIEFIGHTFSLGDEDSLATTRSIRNPWPNAVTVYGTAHHTKILYCYAGPRNYKPFVTIDTVEAGKCDTIRAPLDLEIGWCQGDSVQMFFGDVNPHGGYFHDNTVNTIVSNIDNGAAAFQFFTRSQNVLATRNTINGIAIAFACQNDTGTVITHNNYGYFFPYGARITNGSSVNCTVDEPSLYPAPVLKPEMVNLVTDPSLEKWYSDKTLQTKQTDFTGPYLSRTLPGDTTFPDARVVTSKFHTGAASWYANCLYRSNPATNAQQATFGYDTTYALYLDTGLYMASAWVWAVNNSITSIKIRDFGQVDSTYDVTNWPDAVDSQWVQVRSYFRHTRTGKVKVQWITHHNSTCFWDDFFFGKIDGARAVAVFDSLQNPYSTLRGGGIATVDTNQMYHQNAKVIHDSLAVIRMAQVAMDSSNGSDYMDAMVDYRMVIKRKNGINPNSTQWLSDSTLNEFIKEGAIEVGNAVGPYVGVKIVTLNDNQSSYTLDSLVMKIIDVTWKHGDSVKSLVPKPMSEWQAANRQFCSGYLGFEARPDFYWRTGSYLNVYPPPYIVGESLLVTAKLRLPNISAGSSYQLIPQNYRVAILKYATWQAALAKQSPLAGEFEKQYVESITVLKAMVESDTEMRVGATTGSK